MMEMPSGSFGDRVFKSMLLATQTLPFESSARARTPMPARKFSTLSGIVGREAGDRVSRRVGDPDAIPAAPMPSIRFPRYRANIRYGNGIWSRT